MSKKNYEMTLMERIDFIRANSVTDDEFKKMWGYSIDEHVEKMMKWCRKFDELSEKSKHEV